MIELGSSFVIMGTWDTTPEPPDKTVIRMPPSPPGVYGCWNKTTAMCVEAMERRLQPGVSFLDFGTGSGILAVVAYHLGASPVYATEIDAAAAEFAQRVWELNQAPVTLVQEAPEVDLCVANVGDHFWDHWLVRHLVKATTIINISNAGKEVVVHA